MIKCNQVSIEVIRELLIVDPDVGKLFWRIREPKWFPDQRSCNSWNARFAGKEAFTFVTVQRYRRGRILGVDIPAHRIIWAFVYGDWTEQIDHENGLRSDNRIANLRAANGTLNARNRKIPTNNKSGMIGVYWHKRQECWIVSIGVNGKQRQIGSYLNKFDAFSARKAAENEFKYHPNHGRSA